MLSNLHEFTYVLELLVGCPAVPERAVWLMWFNPMHLTRGSGVRREACMC